MLRFTQFLKSYGHVQILNIEELTLQSGIYWVKGPNGSGKSTLLKSIGGFLSFKGDISVDGISLKKKGLPYRKIVNFADAEPIYPEFLTGWEMIKMFKQAKGAPADQEQYFIESMNMQNYLDSPLGTYSSGMLKKLSLVLAFLGRPKLILLDEPLITIDTQSLTVLYDWIRTKLKDEDVTFLLSSHQALDTGMLPEVHEISIENRKLNLEF
jgi:ABC-2 type transport system ATP-binding protein